MLTFFAGVLVGLFFGIFLMCLAAISGEADCE